jgi:serine/threonine protein phosphatase PrpC
MPWLTALATDSPRTLSEDRAAIFGTRFGLLTVVADGVGGRSGGGAAADDVVEAVRQFAGSLTSTPTPSEFTTWLRTLDLAMTNDKKIGETTAIVAALSEGGVAGVAVGDSEAWHFPLSEQLTLGSHRKPWLGSGSAIPMTFRAPLGTLVLATDGLTKYSDRNAWPSKLLHDDLSTIPNLLIDCARSANGNLADDVAVIVARWS